MEGMTVTQVRHQAHKCEDSLRRTVRKLDAAKAAGRDGRTVASLTRRVEVQTRRLEDWKKLVQFAENN